jgi:glycosyltransferase involved in cell wall biosynthesis
MSISIVIPTFNRAKLINRAIQSVLHQTRGNWELIIADDGSTDNTYEVVARFLSEKVKYIRQDNAGANRARNYGASVAKYDYLTFLDSDDELFPEWIEEFHAAMEHRPEIICCGTVRVEPEKSFAVMPNSLGKIFGNGIGKFTNGACYAIRHSVFDEAGRFDEQLRSSQHTELAFRLAAKVSTGDYKIISIFKPLVKIYIHDGPRIRTNSQSKFQGARRIFDKHQKLMSGDPKLVALYAKIVTFLAAKNSNYAIAIRYLVIYLRYWVIMRFTSTSK